MVSLTSRVALPVVTKHVLRSTFVGGGGAIMKIKLVTSLFLYSVSHFALAVGLFVMKRLATVTACRAKPNHHVVVRKEAAASRYGRGSNQAPGCASGGDAS